MNAKFEKWFSEKNAACWNAALSGDAIAKGIVAVARDSYHTAIQSLEVTPQLTEVYCAAVNEQLGSLTKKQWMIERADPSGSIHRVATIGLAAVLSALKEQAK